MAVQPTNPDPLHQAIGRALGRIPSGVFILGTLHESRRSAMMASWVQQAGFDPPAVCLGLGKDRWMRGPITASRLFALSVIGEEDGALMRRYARPFEPSDDPFEGVPVVATPRGLPVLAESLAWLECELMHTCDFGGDHDLLIARVTAGDILKPGKSFRHLRGNGYHY